LLRVAIDQGVNLRVLRRLQRDGRVELVQAHSLEQEFRHVGQHGRLFRLDISTLDGPDMLAGDNVHAVEALIGRDIRADVDHVYAAWLNTCDYFATENVDDFIRDGRRERLEELLPGLKIRTTAELLNVLDEGTQQRGPVVGQ
jgi:hypothetical protein